MGNQSTYIVTVTVIVRISTEARVFDSVPTVFQRKTTAWNLNWQMLRKIYTRKSVLEVLIGFVRPCAIDERSTWAHSLTH